MKSAGGFFFFFFFIILCLTQQNFQMEEKLNYIIHLSSTEVIHESTSSKCFNKHEKDLWKEKLFPTIKLQCIFLTWLVNCIIQLQDNVEPNECINSLSMVLNNNF